MTHRHICPDCGETYDDRDTGGRCDCEGSREEILAKLHDAEERTEAAEAALRRAREPDAYCVTTPDGGCVAKRCMHSPPLTLDSTLREVAEALDGREISIREVESQRNETDDGFDTDCFEASCTTTWEGDDDRGTRRLAALAPTALEALIALANEVRKETGR